MWTNKAILIPTSVLTLIFQIHIEFWTDVNGSVSKRLCKLIWLWVKIVNPWKPYGGLRDSFWRFCLLYEFSLCVAGEYSALSIHLSFSRNSHFYLTKFYWPVVTTILISWLPFWLGRVLILRVYVACSTILFLGWHYLAQPNQLTVSYYVLLDFWRGVNLAFVLLAASESILVTYMIKTNKNKIKRTHPDDNEKLKMFPDNNCPEKVSIILRRILSQIFFIEAMFLENG